VNALHQACARTIAEALERDAVFSERAAREAAAAAVRVVLAEATRSIERVQADCDWRGRDALDMALVELKRLGEQA
jgi:hypothetical protein